MVLRLTPPKPQPLSSQLRAGVLDALPFCPPGMTPMQVRTAAGSLWAPATIGRTLSALVREGIVQFEGPMGQRRYWLADQAAAPRPRKVG